MEEGVIMGNRIDEVVNTLKEREHITYREIAERCKIPEQTLHSARRRKSMDSIHVDVFLKIAHGLGMTAEELYYGDNHKTQSHVYSDSRQQEANEIWSHVNETYRKQMWEHAKVIDMAYNKSAERDSLQEVAI